MFRVAPLLLLTPLIAVAQPPDPPPPGVSNWPFDEITLKNGAKFRGLIVSETPTELVFKSVRRPPGKPTVTLTSRFSRDEIAHVKPLMEAERAALKERLAELDPGGKFERERMDALELAPAMWLGRPGAALQYDSDHFTLVSSATEEVTRRAAVRLEQIYTAFARFLPPGTPDVKPTRVLLAPSRDEYQALLTAVGQADLLNPAVFDPKGNTILCGSNLGPLGDELQKAKFHHSQQLVTLARYEESVKKLYRKPELDRYLDSVRHERQKVYEADRKNGEKFDQAAARLLALLYHEAFHAYAAVFVYPPLQPDDVKAGKGTGELPRWLNEGLAQVFETAVVEAGELRADHPDRARLEEARKRLRAKDGGGLMPLSDLLLSGREAFLAHHLDQRADAGRAYLTSWALAYYLTFDRRAIGTAAFRQYLVAVNSGGDPRQEFETLVGQELTAFERDWHAYLLRI
jgi:hypothetical protein